MMARSSCWCRHLHLRAAFAFFHHPGLRPALKEHLVAEVPAMARSYQVTQNPQVFFGPGAESIVLK